MEINNLDFKIKLVKNNDITIVGEKLEKNISKKYRNWLILLYEDSTSYDFKNVLRIIKGQKKWAYIKHIPESNEKKEHFHCIVSLDSPCTKSALAKKLGIQENYIDEIKNFRSICRYLIHKDDEDKYQYSLDQVFLSNNFTRDFLKCFDDLESEEDIIINIYEYINYISTFKLSYFESLKSLVIFVNQNAYDTIYKRYRNEFTEYLKNTCI